MFLVFFMGFSISKILAQEVRFNAEFPDQKVDILNPVTITIIQQGIENRPTCKFPEITGFNKKSLTYSASTMIQNGKNVLEHKVVQEYFAKKTGTFFVPSLIVKVNDFSLSTNPSKIIITETGQKKPIDEFSAFIDGSAYDMIQVKDDAFFAISTNKDRPFVGEAFLITAAFYIAEKNKADLNFINENEQLDKILKNLKPKNCWEENIKIDEIKTENLVKINKKSYFQYKLYQSFFYPFNNQSIKIPAQSWTMLKYKVAKDQQLSSLKQEDYKTYRSEGLVISPQNLPPKPSTGQFINTGYYFFDEKTSNNQVQTGKSFQYLLNIRGFGNFKLLEINQAKSDSIFEIYKPTIETQFVNIDGKLIQEKKYMFDIIPKFAGYFNLANYFQLEFFNTKTKKYEILKSNINIKVVGQTIVDNSKMSDNEDDIYKNIEKLDIITTTYNWRDLTFKIAIGLIVLSIILLTYLAISNKK